MATPRKLWETNVGLRPANHITSTFVCLAILWQFLKMNLKLDKMVSKNLNRIIVIFSKNATFYERRVQDGEEGRN